MHCVNCGIVIAPEEAPGEGFTHLVSPPGVSSGQCVQGADENGPYGSDSAWAEPCTDPACPGDTEDAAREAWWE